MRLILLADTHDRHQGVDVPNGDVLIIAGDITMFGRERELQRFNAWLARHMHPLKILVPGNHDLMFSSDYRRASSLVWRCVCLLDEGFTYRGLKFYGTPWGCRMNMWSFSGPPPSGWGSIPIDTNILITHAPPAGILDRTWAGQHAGHTGLWNRVAVVKPDLHVFGHIHEGRGEVTYGETRFMNVSVTNPRYQLTGQPIVLDV